MMIELNNTASQSIKQSLRMILYTIMLLEREQNMQKRKKKSNKPYIEQHNATQHINHLKLTVPNTRIENEKKTFYKKKSKNDNNQRTCC